MVSAVIIPPSVFSIKPIEPLAILAPSASITPELLTVPPVALSFSETLNELFTFIVTPAMFVVVPPLI